MKYEVPLQAKSIISSKGQTVIPKEIRKALGMKAGTTLIWRVEDGGAYVVAIPDDPVAASVGGLKHLKLSTADLLEERRADREKEEAQVEETLERWRTTS